MTTNPNRAIIHETDHVPDMTVPEVTPEWLTKDIVRIPGLLTWGNYLIDVANQVPRWTDNPYDADWDYPGPKDILVTTHYAACLVHAEQGLFKIISKVLDVYKQGNPFVEIHSDSGYHLLKYEEGARYNVHCDQLSGRAIPKLITVLIYPNDDYEGGEVYFPRQGIEIKPTVGDVIAFPSGIAFPHGTRPAKAGTRYCVVSWLA